MAYITLKTGLAM